MLSSLDANFVSSIFQIDSSEQFNQCALQLFEYQSEHNLIYKNYLKAIKIAPGEINSFEKIPFLPIEFYKTHQVISGNFIPEITFTSSGTTQSLVSRHLVKSLSDYESTFSRAFAYFYGDIAQYQIYGLLPSYLEREGSSLVYMVQKVIEKCGGKSGFFLRDLAHLKETILYNEARNQRSILIGVTYALLDLAQQYPMPLKNTIVMETGGMKGMREELTRQEVMEILKGAFNVSKIHSEYGMTELMSQAYSVGEGIFNSPPWMKILARDVSDPFDVHTSGQGAINIIDLANAHTCAFIATQDLGKVHSNGSFEISGRLDHADIRGCNLMVM